MNKKKIGKKILIVVFVLLLIFLVHLVRNIIILSSISTKSKGYESKTNYYLKVSGEDSGLDYIETYIKDDKRKTVVKRKSTGDVMTQYVDGNSSKVFWDLTDGRKIMREGMGNIFSLDINVLDIGNSKKDLLNLSVICKIRTEKVNDNKYYVISAIFTDDGTCYINKETGLVDIIVNILDNNKKSVVNREYSFDTVEDKDFELPNILEYTIEK